MKKKVCLIVIVLVALFISACGDDDPEEIGGFIIPAVQRGKFNVAMVLFSSHDDRGWSQAHYEGLGYLEENVAIHTAYVENVPEGFDSEPVFLSLSLKGFNLIIGTSYGYQDAMERIAEDFPEITYITIGGTKSNDSNFGSLYGAMETVKYLTGMLAGARAKMDGNPYLAYMVTFPIPEEFRMVNAVTLGMKETCPECELWVGSANTWHDPVVEKEVTETLFGLGAQVIISGTDTAVAAEVARDQKKWAVTSDWIGSCILDSCLTVPYWNWGPVYASLIEAIKEDSYSLGLGYFDADSGGLGLYGFMDGQNLKPGVAELPAELLQGVQGLLELAQKGEFDRFGIFSGPIYDNTGRLVVPEGESLEQNDLNAFPDLDMGCYPCMGWLAEGAFFRW